MWSSFGSLVGRSLNIYPKCFNDKAPFLLGFAWHIWFVPTIRRRSLLACKLRRGSQAAIQNQVFCCCLGPLQSKRRMWVSPLILLYWFTPLFGRLQPAWSLKLNTVVSLCFVSVVCLVWESSSQTVVGVWHCDYLSGTQSKEESYVRWWYLCLWSWLNFVNQGNEPHREKEHV